jgi:hypothetical protein
MRDMVELMQPAIDGSPARKSRRTQRMIESRSDLEAPGGA